MHCNVWCLCDQLSIKPICLNTEIVQSKWSKFTWCMGKHATHQVPIFKAHYEKGYSGCLIKVFLWKNLEWEWRYYSFEQWRFAILELIMKLSVILLATHNVYRQLHWYSAKVCLITKTFHCISWCLLSSEANRNLSMGLHNRGTLRCHQWRVCELSICHLPEPEMFCRILPEALCRVIYLLHHITWRVHTMPNLH